MTANRVLFIDNRVLSKSSCTVCGRLGWPHAIWCAEVTQRLEREAEAAEQQLRKGERT